MNNPAEIVASRCFGGTRKSSNLDSTFVVAKGDTFTAIEGLIGGYRRMLWEIFKELQD